MSDKPPELPDAVKVGYLDYALVVLGARAASAANVYGQCSHECCEIRIDFSHAPRVNAHTLLHELLHAVATVYNRADGADEETTVTTLSNGLAGVWRDNPGVFAWIAAGLMS